MQITIFTIFPEMFNSFCCESLLGKAQENNIWKLKIVNIRDYADNKHNKVDDKVYGGGQGMVMLPEILEKAIINNCDIKNTTFIYMSPRGTLLNQKYIKQSLELQNIAIICGRYEGIDQRLIDEFNMFELSIGDYVLMGGELPAMVFIESLIRCLPKVVNDKNSIIEDSFGGAMGSDFDNLLEFPIYTTPAIWKNRKVPDILLSGNHKKIKEWKLEQAKNITKTRRIDLWCKYLQNKLI